MKKRLRIFFLMMNYRNKKYIYFFLNARALMEDDLLQQVRKPLHYRHPLPRGEGGAPHGGRCVELRRAELRGGGGAAAGSGVDGAAGGGSRCSCTR